MSKQVRPTLGYSAARDGEEQCSNAAALYGTRRAEIIMARAIMLTNRPDRYVQSYFMPSLISVLANGEESIDTRWSFMRPVASLIPDDRSY
jgi:hypothetical protein